MDYVSFSPRLEEVVFNYFEQDRNQLWIISLKDGKQKLLGSVEKANNVKQDQVLRQLVCSPDGKYVFYKTTPSQLLWKIARNGEGGFIKCELNM